MTHLTASLEPFTHWPCAVAAIASVEVSHWISQRRSLILLAFGITIGLALSPVFKLFKGRKNAVK